MFRAQWRRQIVVGAVRAGALGLSHGVASTRRARSTTPGDVQNGRVGPDPTMGPKTVAGAPRAQNTDSRPKRAHTPHRQRPAFACCHSYNCDLILKSEYCISSSKGIELNMLTF